MNWCVGNEDQISVKSIYNQFTNVNPKTGLIKKQVFIHQPNRYYSQYHDWKRIKYRGKNYQAQKKILYKSHQNFIDNQFQHINSSISFEDAQQEHIEWTRVIDLIQDAVYSREHNNKSFAKFTFNHLELQNAFKVIGRVQPKSLKELLSKIINDEGIYEFRLFYNGVIQNVIIDDYVPSYKNKPIFTGPARLTEVYPMLLEKAMAKLCGSYENIPKNTEKLIEMIICGAAKTLPLKSTKINDFKQTINSSLDKGLVTLFQSKNDPKVRNYGINEEQIYEIINKYNVQGKQKKQLIYELVSQNRISAWNGNFCFNDPIWKQIQQKSKDMIFTSIKQNKSFCIGEGDIERIAQELMVFENYNLLNKDWVDGQSNNLYPVFVQFEVNKADRVFIKVSTASSVRNCLILAKVQKQTYTFIGSKFDPDSDAVQLHIQLEQGNYVLYLLHEWILYQKGYYCVYLSSNHHIYLENGAFSAYPSFLEVLFMQYSKQHIDSTTNKLYGVYNLFNETGFTFLHIRCENSKSNIIKVTINQKKLVESNWQVIKPYKDCHQISIMKQTDRGSDKIIILRSIIPLNSQKSYFPSLAFSLKEQ